MLTKPKKRTMTKDFAMVGDGPQGGVAYAYHSMATGVGTKNNRDL